MLYKSKIFIELIVDILVSTFFCIVSSIKLNLQFGIYIFIGSFIILYLFSAIHAFNFMFYEDHLEINNSFLFWLKRKRVFFYDVEQIDIFDVVGSFELSLRVVFKNGKRSKFGFRGFTETEKEEIIKFLNKKGIFSKRITK